MSNLPCEKMDVNRNPERKSEGKETLTAALKCSPGPEALESTPLPVQNGQNHQARITDDPDAITPAPEEIDVKDQPMNAADVANEEPEIGEAADTVIDIRPAHSAFNSRHKQFIVLMVTLASFFSPLSGQIYYPVMPTLVKSYHLTPALVNLTITTYMILQGLAPSFIGTFADTCGRRPAYIIAFAVYTAANIGLALQNSFVALLLLRCLQSAGSSGTVSFGYGVIADIATSAERGKYMGPMAAGVMIAPALGPVIGGVLSEFLGWRSVFWFLAIISGTYLIVYIIAVPETARSIVGDGRYPPRPYWRLSFLQYLSDRDMRRMVRNSSYLGPYPPRRADRYSVSPKLSFPNPFDCFVILLEKDALIVIFYVGLVMFANIALLTSTPSLFGTVYGFNDLQIGLCFL